MLPSALCAQHSGFPPNSGIRWEPWNGPVLRSILEYSYRSGDLENRRLNWSTPNPQGTFRTAGNSCCGAAPVCQASVRRDLGGLSSSTNSGRNAYCVSYSLRDRLLMVCQQKAIPVHDIRAANKLTPARSGFGLRTALSAADFRSAARA